MLVVVDTNVLLVSISDRSKYHWLYKAIVEGKISVSFTYDILIEYEEMIGSHWHPEVATQTIRSLIELSTAKLTVSYFTLNLIKTDPDDNKFVDCAFASNADYIVTHDRDFNILKTISFPSIRVVDLDAFKDILIKNEIIQLPG